MNHNVVLQQSKTNLDVCAVGQLCEQRHTRAVEFFLAKPLPLCVQQRLCRRMCGRVVASVARVCCGVAVDELFERQLCPTQTEVPPAASLNTGNFRHVSNDPNNPEHTVLSSEPHSSTSGIQFFTLNDSNYRAENNRERLSPLTTSVLTEQKSHFHTAYKRVDTKTAELLSNSPREAVNRRRPNKGRKTPEPKSHETDPTTLCNA